MRVSEVEEPFWNRRPNLEAMDRLLLDVESLRKQSLSDYEFNRIFGHRTDRSTEQLARDFASHRGFSLALEGGLWVFKRL